MRIRISVILLSLYCVWSIVISFSPRVAQAVEVKNESVLEPLESAEIINASGMLSQSSEAYFSLLTISAISLSDLWSRNAQNEQKKSEQLQVRLLMEDLAAQLIEKKFLIDFEYFVHLLFVRYIYDPDIRLGLILFLDILHSKLERVHRAQHQATSRSEVFLQEVLDGIFLGAELVLVMRLGLSLSRVGAIKHSISQFIQKVKSLKNSELILQLNTLLESAGSRLSSLHTKALKAPGSEALLSFRIEDFLMRPWRQMGLGVAVGMGSGVAVGTQKALLWSEGIDIKERLFSIQVSLVKNIYRPAVNNLIRLAEDKEGKKFQIYRQAQQLHIELQQILQTAPQLQVPGSVYGSDPTGVPVLLEKLEMLMLSEPL